MIRAGYQCATTAKLLEITHKAQAEGKEIDKESIQGQGVL